MTTPDAWQGDPDECSQGCRPGCRHQRAADEHGRLCEEFEQQYGPATPAEFRTLISANRDDQHQEQQ